MLQVRLKCFRCVSDVYKASMFPKPLKYFRHPIQHFPSVDHRWKGTLSASAPLGCYISRYHRISAHQLSQTNKRINTQINKYIHMNEWMRIRGAEWLDERRKEERKNAGVLFSIAGMLLSQPKVKHLNSAPFLVCSLGTHPILTH